MAETLKYSIPTLDETLGIPYHFEVNLRDASLRKTNKMGRRWWQDVLIRNQPKRYINYSQARKRGYWFVSFRKTK